MNEKFTSNTIPAGIVARFWAFDLDVDDCCTFCVLLYDPSYLNLMLILLVIKVSIVTYKCSMPKLAHIILQK